jgi:hypothetical protein
MSLRQRQSDFARALGLLITFAYQQGYELTIADVQSFPAHNRHKRGSKHYQRLAADLNLFKDGYYQRLTSAHEPLGLFWESLGGIWGGRFNDGNHYEWP